MPHIPLNMDKSLTGIGHAFSAEEKYVWTKVGQLLDNNVSKVLSNVKYIGQINKICTNLGQSLDKTLTNDQKYKRTWTKLGHLRSLDKNRTIFGQRFDIFPIFIQFLSGHPFYKSTMKCMYLSSSPLYVQFLARTIADHTCGPQCNINIWT